MDNFIFYSLGFLLLLPILIGYYFDYKNDPNEFKLSLKSLSSNALLFLIIYFSLVNIYEHTIPLNKNNGIEFNSIREKLGIPKIGGNWKLDKAESNQFKSYWWKAEPRSGHFKKVIEYGILNAKTETDYYQNGKQVGTFAWSVFNFENNKFDYFIEKPNDNIISVTEKGNFKIEKPTILVRVSKTEFEKYITE